MDEVRDVLVVPDDDPRTLPALMETAALVAASSDTRIVVLDEGRSPRGFDPLDGLSTDVRPRLDLRRGSGRPEHDILEHVGSEDCDLVLVGERHYGRRSARRRLVRKVPVPMWVVPSVTSPVSDVAVAVGPFPQGEDVEDHHAVLVETAAGLARRRGGRLHVVHAWKLDGESFMHSSRIHLSRDEIAELKDEAAWWARRKLNAVLRACRLDGVRHEIRMEQGQADHALSRFIGRRNIRDLVVGSAARTGVTGMAIGNTAERLEMEGNSLLIVPKHAMMVRQAVRMV